MHAQRMVALTSLPPFQARLLAARLGAEGLLWELRGASSVYPFAPVDVLVPIDEVEQAQEVLALEPLDPGEPLELLDPAGFGATEAGAGVVLADDGCDDPQGGASRPERRRMLGIGRLWLSLAVLALVLALCAQISHWG